VTNQPFPDNQISEARISAHPDSSASICEPNAAGDRFVAQAPIPAQHELFLRFDHQISTTQRVYGRWTRNEHESDSLGYTPTSYHSDDRAAQPGHQLRLDITPRTVLSLGSEFSAFDYARNLSVWQRI